MTTISYGDPRAPMRFWSKVEDRPSGCWTWVGTKLNSGYGYFGAAGKGYTAHRYAYQVFIGDAPKGIDVEHECHTRNLDTCHIPGGHCPHRLCVNPAHLSLKTRKENTLAGHAVSAEHSRKTHCKNGHEFTPENTRIAPYKYGTTRRCRACDRARDKRRRSSEKARRAAPSFKVGNPDS